MTDAEIIPFKAPKKVELKCSFCGKPQSIAKPPFITSEKGNKAANICGDCIGYCYKIMKLPN